MSEPYRGIIYLLMGNSHAAVLATSIHSLRKHWAGPITIFVCEPDGKKFAERIAIDERCFVHEFESAKTGRFDGYVNKTRICRKSRYEETLFLDADTVVCGPVDRLFYANEDRAAFTATAFSNWTTKCGPMPTRIAKWHHVVPELVRSQQCHPMLAVNTGVFSFTRECEQFLHAWEELTTRNPSFICDEIACQLLLPRYPHRVLPDAWNWSPLYGKAKEPIIMHFHGKKHLRPQAIKYWWPAFQECLAADVGGIRTWLPAGDQKLRTHLQANGWPASAKEVA